MLFPLSQILSLLSFIRPYLTHSFRLFKELDPHVSLCWVPCDGLSAFFAGGHHIHGLPWLSLNCFSFYSFSFHYEMWDSWRHVSCYPYFLKADYSFWFIIDFNRKQKDFKRNLIDINMFPLVLLVASKRKLFLRDFFLKLVRIF